MRQRPRQAHDGRLARRVRYQPSGRDGPADAAQVHNRCRARRLQQAGEQRLGKEEVVAQVHAHRLVPPLGRNLLGRFDHAECRAVDEAVDAREVGEDLGRCGLQLALNVRHVAVVEDGPVADAREVGDLFDDFAGEVIFNVQEDDLRALLRKVLNHGCPDAHGAAGDDDDSVVEARVLGVVGVVSHLV